MIEGAQTELPESAVVVARLDDLALMRRIIRERADAHSISRRTLDELAGLPDGYSEKLLCEPPLKNIGPMSMIPLAGAVGLELFLVQTPKAMRQVQRAPKRIDHKVRQGAKHGSYARRLGIASELMRQNGAVGGKKRFATMTPEQRSRHQSRAAKRRWKRWRALRAQASAEATTEDLTARKGISQGE